MADAKRLTGDLAEADRQGQVVVFVGMAHHFVAVETGRDLNRGDRIGIPFFLFRNGPHAPGADRGPHRAGHAPVASKHVVQPLFHEHVQGFTQAAQQIHRRGVREKALVVGGHLILPVEKGFGQIRAVAPRQGLVADRDNAEAGRQHQALL